jgi:hypothetical protein
LDCRAANRALDVKLVETKHHRSPVKALAETLGLRLFD